MWSGNIEGRDPGRGSSLRTHCRHLRLMAKLPSTKEASQDPLLDVSPEKQTPTRRSGVVRRPLSTRLSSAHQLVTTSTPDEGDLVGGRDGQGRGLGRWGTRRSSGSEDGSVRPSYRRRMRVRSGDFPEPDLVTPQKVALRS